ncbi:MAG: GTP-binding protein TypA [Deltaproteobacteria bacterium RBG_16_54_11]|jgi:GTP-binding protein|nr:MAG: GTP-binding protein TypA [Deltaproteobacteria bacterium RBG_16_54_11]
MKQGNIRNIAIIAHVDHGKTTLVDQLFRQSGMFRDNEVVEERLMDSLDLERERGITISSKNGSFVYKDFFINIIDTPGHADFGGQVERVLKMADGALLLVDAAEGPMPQTRFVLHKALTMHMPVIVVINKIDKPAARCAWAVDQVFDLFVKLGAPDDLLDFPVMYTSAKEGYATRDYTQNHGTMVPLFEMIVNAVPPPTGNPEAPLQMLVSSLSYSPFLGRLAIGKITSGLLNTNRDAAVIKADGSMSPARITKIYRFRGNGKEEIETAGAGEIVSVAGMESVVVGETLADPEYPLALPGITVDPPTLSMNFIPNDSPFSGKEGRFLTSRHLRERLIRETLSDVALAVEEMHDGIGYKVSGRGELHLSILIETMRREGYEFQVTRPRVILKEGKGGTLEPYEELTIDVDGAYAGTVIENLGKRKGQMVDMHHDNGMVRMRYRVPTRGLIGFRSEFLTETKGMGTMSYIFDCYDSHAGAIKNRNNGALVVKDQCSTVAYALFNLQERGQLFLGPGEKVYGGQIIGEHSRENDLVVNPAKGKKLTNMRAAGSDDAVVLPPCRKMSLEECISYINDDELVEITPSSIRLRKIMLDENQRKRARLTAEKQ